MRIGEILDRAVSLLFARAGTVFAIIVIAALPIALLNAFLAPDVNREIAVLDGLNHGTPAQSDQAVAEMMFGAMSQRLMLLLAVGGALRLVMWSALVVVVRAAAANVQVSVSIGAAYKVAIRRLPAQILTAFVYVPLAILAMLPGAALWIGVGEMVLAVHRVGSGLTTLALIAAPIALALVAVAFGWLFIAYALSNVAVVDESTGPLRAVRIGLAGAFGRRTRWRSLGAGLVIVALNVCALFLLTPLAGVLSAVTHLPFLAWSVVAAGKIAVAALVGAFVVTYSVELQSNRDRIRPL